MYLQGTGMGSYEGHPVACKSYDYCIFNKHELHKPKLIILIKASPVQFITFGYLLSSHNQMLLILNKYIWMGRILHLICDRQCSGRLNDTCTGDALYTVKRIILSFISAGDMHLKAVNYLVNGAPAELTQSEWEASLLDFS